MAGKQRLDGPEGPMNEATCIDSLEKNAA
jgi:hypothetical protein